MSTFSLGKNRTLVGDLRRLSELFRAQFLTVDDIYAKPVFQDLTGRRSEGKRHIRAFLSFLAIFAITGPVSEGAEVSPDEPENEDQKNSGKEKSSEQKPGQGESGNEKSSEGKPGSLKGVIITAVFTLLGGVIGVLGKGWYDLQIQKDKSSSELQLEEKKKISELDLEKEKFEENTRLERQKLDSDIIKMVLQSSGSDRAETLGFMVDTNLISDSEIRKGVKEYLATKKPVPQLETSERSKALEDNIQAISDLAHRTEEFLMRMQATGAAYKGNEAFYTDVKARLATIRLRAQQYPNNQAELKEIDLLSANLDNLAALHRLGPLTGAVGKDARQLIETNFESLLQVELAAQLRSEFSPQKSD